MGRLTVNKPVSEMTMVELAHNNCFVKDGETFYRDYEGEMSARDMTRELAKMSGYELPDNNEEFDCEIMDDLYVTENVTERNLIALFYRNLWAQAELYEYLKKYEDTGITPEKIREIDKLYEEKCRELAEERKKNEWIPCSERLPENEDVVEITFARKHYSTGEILYFTARAFYENGKMNTEDSDYCWMDTDNWEYDEEKDAYIIPEGWFEYVTFSDEFGDIDMSVIAWRPLPEPYNPERSNT